MNYYVFRIDYGQNHKMICDKIFQEHELRQGWGGEGFSLNQSLDQFIESWERKWDPGKSTDRNYKKGKYNTLAIMKEISIGDYIIIPKLKADGKSGRFFTIVRCESGYEFNPIKIDQENNTDFGHILRVTPLATFSYTNNQYSRKVSAKFRAYQNAVNRVNNEDFKEAVNQLLSMGETSKKDDMLPIEALASGSADARNVYLRELIKIINSWSPSQLEKIIVDLFKKQGYYDTARNRYDREGGDIDIVFSAFPEQSFIANLINLSSSQVDIPEIRVQAKKKAGNDSDEIKGIMQLLKMQGHENALNIVINTTEQFEAPALKIANEKGIILINGMQFADLLVKYGIDYSDIYDNG